MKQYLILIIFTLLFITKSEAQQDTILIDFGNDLSEFPWNNVSNPNNGSINDLINSDGFTTGISIGVNDAFNGINNSGTLEADAGLNIPATASGDSFFGNTVEFSNQTEPTGGVIISNLDKETIYTLNIFSSRIATDNRDTKYIITGATIDTLELSVSSNQDQLVNFSSLPNSDGTITIGASPGDDNDNTNGFFYLGLIKIIYEEVEVGLPSLSLSVPNGGEFWQVGKTAKVKWQSENIGSVGIEYSTDNGNNWTIIDTVPAGLGHYEWLITDTPSEECLISIYTETNMSISEEVFEISEDSSVCTIVILGSSTAAGTGPSRQDSAWVNRYSDELYSNDTRYEIINLARGGTTTYNILPTGTVIDPTINMTIDTLRNVTKALSYNPYAIIVNMPSNDAANFFPVADQIKNFNSIDSIAEDENIEVYICTTQPRNFNDETRLMIQQEARDSIFSIYGDNAIDFWNDIATGEGRILPEFDSGDGVHLNDAGHRILVDRVLTTRIDTLCSSSIISSNEEINTLDNQAEIYFNAIKDAVIFKYDADINNQVLYSLYDLNGSKISEVQSNTILSGKQSYQWQIPGIKNLPASLYAAKLEIRNSRHSSYYSKLIYINN